LRTLHEEYEVCGEELTLSVVLKRLRQQRGQ
jgi:hypothetical protein